METLHTILLGPYKYLLKTLIPRLTSIQKKQVLARMSTFNYCGFKGKVIGNLIHYHKLFVGRDYKAWAQMALFVIGSYLSEGEKKVWLSLSKVLVFDYVQPIDINFHPFEPICRYSGWRTVHRSVKMT